MDKFISIGVNQGDAFYLLREEKKILVDGGLSRKGFPLQFNNIVKNYNLDNELDIVVCTHADSDHINGLLGLIESGIKIKEVWLPGRWTSRLIDILKKPIDFEIEIFKNLNSLDDEIDNLEDLYKEEHLKVEDESKFEEIDLNIDTLYQAIEDVSDKQDITFLTNKFIFFHDMYFLENKKYEIFIDAIDTARKIKELSILAYNSGAKIRWFEYSNNTSSGGESFLVPINSEEIFKISKPLPALMYLSLTKINKESLVFYSPGISNLGNVLFSADSDFSFSQNLSNILNNTIITAPHHGSENNKNVYIKLNSTKNDDLIFVRSDGKSKIRPGNTFKSLNRKVCTLCNTGKSIKNDVIFSLKNGKWNNDNNIWCHCR